MSETVGGSGHDQVARVEMLLAAIHDTLSSLRRMETQLRRELTQLLPDVQTPTATAEVDALRRHNAQLQEALAWRAPIEQAKGMLMHEYGCREDDAFEILVAVSQREKRKVREVAADLVARGAHPGADGDLVATTELSALRRGKRGGGGGAAVADSADRRTERGRAAPRAATAE